MTPWHLATDWRLNRSRSPTRRGIKTYLLPGKSHLVSATLSYHRCASHLAPGRFPLNRLSSGQCMLSQNHPTTQTPLVRPMRWRTTPACPHPRLKRLSSGQRAGEQRQSTSDSNASHPPNATEDGNERRPHSPDVGAQVVKPTNSRKIVPLVILVLSWQYFMETTKVNRNLQ